MRSLILAAAAITLTACSTTGGWNPLIDPKAEDTDLRQEMIFGFTQTPFADGAVTILAPDDGDFRTFTLVPCQDGTHICAGSAHGKAGHLTVTDAGYLVPDAYAGRSFVLLPGGGGSMTTRRGTVPIAWDS